MTTIKHVLQYSALGGLIALQACTSGQSAVEPKVTQVNLAQTAKLQFAVGTANRNGTIGLNTVETFRQSNGLSATLVNTPTITGPTGFLVPAGSGGTDGGTNHISGTPQTPAGQPAIKTTFGQSGGAFAYGFAPINIGRLGSVSFGGYALPFYGAAQNSYDIGPPAVANFRNGLQPGFTGYSSGFADFTGTTVVAGAYSLSVNVQTANAGTIPPFVATANLTCLTPLPAFTTPTYTSDGAGGGTISVTVPAGVTETLVYVQDQGTANNPTAVNYTFLTNATGPQVLVLPDNLGPLSASGATSTTIAAGNTVAVYAVGFDYPAFEASPIGANPSQTPTITGNGCPTSPQADITASDFGTATE